MTDKQKLKVFLCHSSGDKAEIRKLFQQLIEDGFDVWFDENNLLPGHDWDLEIRKAVRSSDIVVVCLSRGSITKAGYIQKEIRLALDVADEKPEGAIYVIPAKLEKCSVPERLSRWQWVNLFEENGYQKLKKALISQHLVNSSISIKEIRSDYVIPRNPPFPIGTPPFALFLDKQTLKKIKEHLQKEKIAETGGILIGRPFRIPNSPTIFVVIVDSFPLETGTHGMSFNITNIEMKVANRQANINYPNLMIVGWYHSHPKYRIFLSGRDRSILKEFFNHSWSISLVIDQINKEQGFFVGDKGEKLDNQLCFTGSFIRYLEDLID